MIRPAFCALCALALGGAAVSLAARPDCGHARTNIERLMCSSDDVGILDDRMALAFREAAYRAADRTELLQEQRQWQLNVRDACNNLPCLREVYQQRIDALEGR